MKTAFVALAVAIAVVGPAAATAPLAFNVTLRANLSEHREYEVRRTTTAGCEETTTGEASFGFRIASARPSLIRVQRARDGGIAFLSATLRHLNGRGGSRGGSAQTPSCTNPGLVAIASCGGSAAGGARAMTAQVARAGTGSIVIRRTRPRLPRSMRCSPALPRAVPRLDLSLAEGQVLVERLLNRKVRAITVFGEYDAQIPVELDNGEMTVTRRVHWRLTFRRAA